MILHFCSRCEYFYATRKGNHSAILTPTAVGGRRPIPSEICVQSDPPTHRFETRRLRQISAYNVSTAIRDIIEKKLNYDEYRKSTTGFPTSYIDGVRTLALSPPKGSSKSDFFVFLLNKIQLNLSNKVCYKVSLHENFQWQSCSMTIPLSNGP